MCPGNVLREYRSTEAILRGVCAFDGFLFGLELANYNEWAKDLVLEDRVMILVGSQLMLPWGKHKFVPQHL